MLLRCLAGPIIVLGILLAFLLLLTSKGIWPHYALICRCYYHWLLNYENRKLGYNVSMHALGLRNWRGENPELHISYVIVFGVPYATDTFQYQPTPLATYSIIKPHQLIPISAHADPFHYQLPFQYQPTLTHSIDRMLIVILIPVLHTQTPPPHNSICPFCLRIQLWIFAHPLVLPNMHHLVIAVDHAY